MDKNNKAVKDRRTENNRRKLLKTLASGAGVATITKSTNSEWAKPIVDSVLLPAHAQTSLQVESIVGNIVLGDDAPGGLTGLGPGSYSFARDGDDFGGDNSDGGGDDGTSVELMATVSPPQAVEVTIQFDTTGGTLDAQADIPTSVIADPTTGIASFGSFSADDLLDGNADGDGSGNTISNIDVRYSALGATESVIDIDFS